MDEMTLFERLGATQLHFEVAWDEFPDPNDRYALTARGEAYLSYVEQGVPDPEGRSLWFIEHWRAIAELDGRV